MSATHLPSIFRAVQEIFPGTVLRTGFSTEHQAAFVVAADLSQGVGYKADAESFIRSLTKGPDNSRTPYLGTEVIQTTGGHQRMRVVYKRGIFHLLATSRLKKAVEFRDRVFDLMEQIEREGFVVNADASLDQLHEMPQRVIRTADELVALRELEIRDYRRIKHAIWEAGGDREDFRDVRNSFYTGLFGMTASAIRMTRPQIGGERYVRDYRHPRTGRVHKAGELRPSDATPDYLTEAELKRLDDAVLWVTTTLGFRFPGGYATLGDICGVLKEFAAQVRPVTKPQEEPEPAEAAPSNLRAQIEALRAKLNQGA
ncbi:hypothetical protein [Streptomyces sp. CO7]